MSAIYLDGIKYGGVEDSAYNDLSERVSTLEHEPKLRQYTVNVQFGDPSFPGWKTSAQGKIYSDGPIFETQYKIWGIFQGYWSHWEADFVCTAFEEAPGDVRIMINNQHYSSNSRVEYHIIVDENDPITP